MNNAIKIYSMSDNVTVEECGGKSSWLSFLYKNNFRIPKTFCLEATDEIKEEDYQKILSFIKDNFDNNDLLAIRSSGILEDGKRESQAGHFKSKVGIKVNETEIIKSLNAVLNSRTHIDEKQKMGIVIQQYINPHISGVLFSCSPNNYNLKNHIAINYVKGCGEQLMSGEVSGTSKVIDLTKQQYQGDFEKQINELISYALKIENICGYPVDIEWCIEEKTNELYLLQCRPITNVFFEKNEFFTIDGHKEYSNQLMMNDKVKLRAIGAKYNVMVGRASIVHCNCVTGEFPIQNINIEKTDICTGYSIVIISPKLINNEVKRKFIESNNNAIYDTLKEFYNIAKKISWTCTIIIQELYDPFITGIMAKNGSKYSIEFMRGHFAAKGIFKLSKYECNTEGDIISKKEVEQKQYYLIKHGEKVLLENTYNNQLVSLSNDNIKKICLSMKSIIDNEQGRIIDNEQKNIAIEFGALLNDDESITPYLIDCTYEKNSSTPSQGLKNGVISEGTITGKLKRINIDIQKSIDHHFHNNVDIQEKCGHDESIIYVCESPNIQLQEILKEKINNIGFIFKTASTLCHFSILLREHAIPAIGDIDIEALDYNKIYTIDTSINGTAKDKVFTNT